MDPTLEACLPHDLRTPTTTIVKIAAGLSGAGVYRVETDGAVYVLKVASTSELLGGWESRVAIQRAAGEAGVGPLVVHVDPSRRAIVSRFVVDRGFMPRLGAPPTRDAALAELADALRRVHAIPLPPDAPGSDGLGLLRRVWRGLEAFPLPDWIGTTVTRVLEETPPAARAAVLSHNDVNPTNLVHDGTRVLFLDWDAAGANDPLYDLAAAAVFLRLDDATCARLIALHDQAPPSALPERFLYLRRLVATMCGVMFLHLARGGGHPGGVGEESLEAVPTLAEVYAAMREGKLAPGAPDGQWALGRALLSTATSLPGPVDR